MSFFFLEKTCYLFRYFAYFCYISFIYVKLIREGRCHFVSYNKPANKKTATVIHPVCKKKEERLIKPLFKHNVLHRHIKWAWLHTVWVKKDNSVLEYKSLRCLSNVTMDYGLLTRSDTRQRGQWSAVLLFLTVTSFFDGKSIRNVLELL